MRENVHLQSCSLLPPRMPPHAAVHGAWCVVRAMRAMRVCDAWASGQLGYVRRWRVGVWLRGGVQWPVTYLMIDLLLFMLAALFFLYLKDINDYLEARAQVCMRAQCERPLHMRASRGPSLSTPRVCHVASHASANTLAP